jgi:hypothetical protein
MFSRPLNSQLQMVSMSLHAFSHDEPKAANAELLCVLFANVVL